MNQAAVNWHIDELRQLYRSGPAIDDIKQLLKEKGTLTFPQLPSGLFPAMNVDINADETGYGNSWLRDTACIAYGLWRSGEMEQASKAAYGILKALASVKTFFEKIVAEGQTPTNNEERPPIRFAGANSVPRTDWANAQNDALGYSLWFVGLISQEGLINLLPKDIEVLEDVLEYLYTIQFWRDLDNGHWEEVPKRNASSIGAVVAGLKAVRPVVASSHYDVMLKEGQSALKQLLPHESDTPGLQRDHDAALLFLVEPLQVVDEAMADAIVSNIINNLVGPYGIRRYSGDSYWCPDYREHFKMGDRAGDFSERMDERDKYLTKNNEAQWTLFDPILCAHFSQRFLATGNSSDKEHAQYYLERSLAQIIEFNDEWRIPEAYFVEHGQWVTNDHLGLLWSQANLLYALEKMKEIS